MTLTRLFAFAAPVLIALSCQAFAAPETYTFDKGHTEVRFCWNHLGISRQCGHFTNFDGELVYDEADPGKSTLNVTFKTSSIETLVPVFNEHMKGEKLFDAAKFPEITFKSTKFEKTSDKTGKVSGDLMIKGVTKPVTLDVTLNFMGAHPVKKTPWLGVAAVVTVKRTDYGVSLFAPAVSDDIAIEIQTEMGKKT
jgi:polyisoprenoid-binding protein YceI